MKWSLLCVTLLLCSALAQADDSLAVFPASIKLTGPEARQRLIAEAVSAAKAVGDMTADARFASSDEKIVKIENGIAIPVGNGAAQITVTSGAHTATTSVTVEGIDKPFAWSFRNHVEPVLAKAGCNSGACHGALAGKKGFKLSLAGFDPVADYFYITRQARSRRISLEDPGRSLLLTKPTGAIPHKGGLRFAVDSQEYKIISSWIAEGAQTPRDDDPKLVRLEMLPPQALLKPGAKQQFVVLAHYSDGHVQDATRWAKYTSTSETVASVDQTGLVQVTGHGEAAIKAWYQSWNVIATVSAAFDQQVAPEVFTQAPRKNFIDDLVLAKLQSLNLPPSPMASDGEFLRRAFVDTIGVLPTAEEARAYLSDQSPNKRDKLIEHLLARPEFVDYWSYKWSDLLLVNSEKLRGPAMWAYYRWIRNQVAANTPWDELARSIVTATGSTLENGASNFYVLHQDPADMAETTSMVFLGMSIACAKCHNHPLEKWTNDQYYAMANLFARVRSKDVPGDGNRVIFSVDAGDLVQPRTGRPQPPQPLDGEALPLDSPVDRRAHVAKWLTAAENPYFSRAITNRVWANFFGVGLVEAVDDLRLTNPPSNEELLAAAAKHLIDSKYDLKAMMRTILQSGTYARSSQPLPQNATDSRLYSRYYPKRMMAEVLLDGLSAATAAPTALGDYPAGWRSLQVPDPNVNSYFLKTFGRPARVITCECERTAQPSMVQVLHISNGDTINQKLESKGNKLEKMLAENWPADKIVEELYLSALTRYPTEQEKTELVAALNDPAETNKRSVLEDVYWSVLSSKEFLFNH